MKKSHVFYIAGAILCIAPLTSRAEGDKPTREFGVFGVNRRVITTPDNTSCGVSGIFTIPVIFVPSDVYSRTTGANSKPTFYLGAKIEKAGGDFEVDAGVQYESQSAPYTFTDPSEGRPRTGTLAPGYGIFVRTSNTSVPAGPNNSINSYAVPSDGSIGYRFGPGTFNPGVAAVNLTLLFYRSGPANIDRKAYLQTNLIGASAQPNGNGRVDAHYGEVVRRGGEGGLTQIQMKRVVGITQGGTAPEISTDFTTHLNFPLFADEKYYEEDGSFMRNSAFSAGRIASNIAAPSWQDWDALANRIDQGNTGSIPGPATLDQSYVGIPYLPIIGPFVPHAPSALPIFQYPGIADPASETMPSRYKNETIDINLRRAVTVSGDLVTPQFRVSMQ